MPESFGGRLRQRREQQQIALSTIADHTKIKLSLLEALEHDDVSHWPSGIFRRAFIRAYAHAIGLEPDVIVREFLELYPDPLEIVATVSDTASGAEGALAGGGPPTRLRYLVDSAIGSVARLRVRVVQRPQSASEELVAVDCTPPREHRLSDWHLADAEPTCAAPLCVEPAPVEPASVKQVDPDEPDLLVVARLCTELGRVQSTSDVTPLLRDAARILDATGLIVWVWHPETNELRPALAHGYSERVLAQLPRVDLETNNATAEAFRASQTCVVNSSDLVSGALVVPLMSAAGCVGVLAVELQHRGEEKPSVRALATIFAAQLATLIGTGQPAEAEGRRHA